MSKKTTYLLGILLTIIIGAFLYCKFCCCCKKESCDKKTEQIVEEKVIAKEATLNPFIIKDDNGNLSLKIEDNFNFNHSGFNILDTIAPNIDGTISKIKLYLDKNPLKSIGITGYYKSDEDNNSAYPNLGLARASAVKNYFVSKGIPSKVIDTYGELNDDLQPNEANVFFGPISYNITTGTEGDTATLDAIKAKCDALKDNPLVLYFKTGAASINLTTEQRQKFVDITRCVDKLGATVEVVGHTDNTGNADNNMVLGQERANFAKNYLSRNGIPSANIEATSKGQTEPIADNSTEEGKAKNRRTVVTIK